MTYDSSVFSRGNYYKDSFYFKNAEFNLQMQQNSD